MRHRAQRQNLKAIRKAGRKAREAAVCQNYRAIYRFLVYLTTDVTIAEDLTQETFTSAWAGIDRYKGRASFATWLHKIAYHKFIDSKRSRERQASLITKLKNHTTDVSQSSDPLYQLMAYEHSCLLYRAMQKLESAEYTTIVLHYIQGMSFREMAKVLDEPVGTVKWRTSRILKKLRAFLIGRAEL